MKRVPSLLTLIGLLLQITARGAFTGSTPRVYYYSNRQVEEVWWDSIANAWHSRAIGQEAKASRVSDPLGFPAGFAAGVTLDPRVYYVTANTQAGRLEVVELAYSRDPDKWNDRDLSQELNAPGVNLQNRGLAGFGTGANLDPRVYYVDISSHTQELAWYGNKWHLSDLSQLTGAQFAYCPVAFGVGASLDPRVYCVDPNGHVRELAWFSNVWHLRDLSQELGAPALAGNVVGFGVGSNLDPRLYYITANKHVEELAWFGNAWHPRDISQAVTAPAPAGTDLLVGFGAGTNLDPRVYYVDNLRQLDELAWFNTDQMWHVYMTTAQGAVPPASFGAGTAVGSGLDPRLYYFSSSRQVSEAAGDSRETAPWVGRSVGVEANAPAADMGSRMVAFGVGSKTVRLDNSISFQTVVDQNPPGSTFIVSAGEHRMQQIVPKDGDVFIGELDANGNLLSSFNGSSLFLNYVWARTSDGYWVAPLGVPGFQRGIQNGQCTGYPPIDGKSGLESSILNNLPCIFPESLFRDDVLQKRVNQIKDLNGGSDRWYFDYDRRLVYADGNPNGHKMEIALTPFAFGYTVAPRVAGNYLPARKQTKNPSRCDPFALDQAGYSNYISYPQSLCGDPLPNPNFPGAYDTYKPARVVIRNLIVEKYANPPQTGAIGYFRPGLDWAIINNEVRYNHGSGIKFKGKAVVVANRAHHNGDFGIESGDGNTLPEYGGHLAVYGNAPFNGLPEWGYWGGFAGSGAVVANNHIWNNDAVLAFWNSQDMRIDSNWGAGGTKFSQAENLLALANMSENNNGPGLWSDFSYDGTTYLGNVVQANQNINGGALFHEVSGSADMVCNTVENNLFDDVRAAPRNSQIFISNSHRVNVRKNKVTVPNISDNSADPLSVITGNAITVEDAGFRTNEELPSFAFDDNVLQNSVTFGSDKGLAGLSGSCYGTTTGCSQNTSVPNIITDSSVVLKHLSTVTFDYDNYYMPDVNQAHWLGLRPGSVPAELDWKALTFSQFKGQGQGQEKNGDPPHIGSGSLPSDCAALISAAQQAVNSLR
jgi:hypothetical protein